MEMMKNGTTTTAAKKIKHTNANVIKYQNKSKTNLVTFVMHTFSSFITATLDWVDCTSETHETKRDKKKGNQPTTRVDGEANRKVTS